MHEFRLSDALRYALPGGLFLLIAALTYTDIPRGLVTDGGLVEATVLAGASLILGAVIQALHRAFVYPIIYRILLVLHIDRRRLTFGDLRSCYTPSRTELQVIEARWRFSAENPHISNRLADWGAQVHFLFGSAWAAAGGALLPKLAGLSPDRRICTISLVLAILLAISGLIHDRRLMFIDSRFAEYAPEEA